MRWSWPENKDRSPITDLPPPFAENRKTLRRPCPIFTLRQGKTPWPTITATADKGQNMDQLVENKRRGRKRILWGLVLVASGIILMVRQYTDLEIAMLWHFWPLYLLVSGLIDVLSATRWKHIAEGLGQIVAGAWIFACIEHLWGFTFSNSWPVLLIGFGVTVVLGGLPDREQQKN
jgi:hypothetical protein